MHRYGGMQIRKPVVDGLGEAAVTDKILSDEQRDQRLLVELIRRKGGR